MKICKTLFFAGIVSVLFTGCADESPWGDSSSGTGKIKLYLSSSNDVSSELPKTKSVSTDIKAPDISLFQVRMTNKAGNYIKTWSSIEEFEKEKEFRPDTYLLEAFYGSPSSQGVVEDEEEGHEHTYFYGKSEEVKVESGKETNIQIQTTLANAAVAIEYSETFKNYFTSWDTQLITKGESSLKLGEKEGLCYVVPGDVDVVISATQQNGKTVKVNPAVFEAEPQHLYKITYNIYNGQVGHAETLQVIFNDQPDAEHTIEIDLSDELLSGDGPVIRTDGFKSEDTIETLSGSPYEGEVKFNIDSPDGYSSVVLTIASKDYQPDFLENGTIDLCKADASQQAALSEAGIKVVGLYNNPERLALVDITEFCRHLPAGEHEITLMVKDRARVADASLKVVTYPIDLKAEQSAPAIFGRRYAELTLLYNGADPTIQGNNPFTFKLKGREDTGNLELKSITKEVETKAFESKAYIYNIGVPDIDAEQYEVEVYFNNGSSPLQTAVVDIDYPSYKVDYDPMAMRVMMRITEVNDPEVNFSQSDIKELFNRRLRVFVDNSEIKGENLSIDSQKDVITAKGLKGGDNFTIKTSLRTDIPSDFENEQTLKYEAQLPVPNGSFEDLTEFFNDEINQGGSWSTSNRDLVNYYNKATFTVSLPKNWSTSNSKTMSGSNVNTWYYIPSVFNSNLKYTGQCPGVGLGTGRDSGTPSSYSNFESHSGIAMVIRNVAWDPSGPTIEKDSNKGTTILGVKQTVSYYNYNVPEIANKSAGKMFLGTYPESELLEDAQGYDFTSRPVKLKGWYNYTKDSSGQDDYGIISIIIYNDNTPIAKGVANLPPVDKMTQFEIDLDSYYFKSSATRIAIMVTSSKYASSSQNYETQNIAVTTYLSKIESYQHGATLVVDEFEFIYE